MSHPRYPPVNIPRENVKAGIVFYREGELESLALSTQISFYTPSIYTERTLAVSRRKLAHPGVWAKLKTNS